jgi:hypothetical protein
MAATPASNIFVTCVELESLALEICSRTPNGSMKRSETLLSLPMAQNPKKRSENTAHDFLIQIFNNIL